MHLDKMVSMGKCHVAHISLGWTTYFGITAEDYWSHLQECTNDDSRGTKHKWLSNQRRFLATSLPVMPAEEFEEEYEQRG